MSKKDSFSQAGHPNRHTGAGQDPMRVASRMPSAMKNRGMRVQKKAGRGK